MHAHRNFNQVQTIFGNGYLPEQHADDAHRYLPAFEHPDSDVGLFDELLKTLRAALSLRQA
jgi:hypothetical protein